MKFCRNGVALGLVIGFATVLATIIFAVMRFSSNEMHFTAVAAYRKKASMLAFSGIQVAEMALAKGRWYQPPYRRPVDKDGDGRISQEELNSQTLIVRPNFSELEFEPDGRGEGSVTVFFQEVPIRGVDLTNNALYARFKLAKADLLDHIKVYSVGKFRGERIMVYGKFIMSPSPLFNSPDIDLASSTATPASLYRVVVDPPLVVRESDGIETPFKIGIIKEILKKAGDKVDPNDQLFAIGDDDMSDGYIATQVAKPKAPVHGVIRSMINPDTNKPWKVGDRVFLPCEMAVIEEDSDVGSDIPSQTIKRMVMVQQIPPGMYAKSALTKGERKTYELLNDIGKFTREVARKYAVAIADKKVFEERVSEVFAAAFPSDGPSGTRVSDAVIVETLDKIGTLNTVPYNRAGNSFIIDMLKNWKPRGFDATPEELANIAKMASFTLGVKETDPKKSCRDLYSICQHFSEWKLDPQATSKRVNESFFSVWRPKYQGSDGFPQSYPLRKVWDDFENTMARRMRRNIVSNPQPGVAYPPYVFNKSNTKNPTAEFLKFRNFESPYNTNLEKYSSFQNTASPQEFVKKMTFLEEAAKSLTLTFTVWVPQQDWEFRNMVLGHVATPPYRLTPALVFDPDLYWPWWGCPSQLYKEKTVLHNQAAEQLFGSGNFGAYGWPDQLMEPRGPFKPGAPVGRPVNLQARPPRPEDLVARVAVPYSYELNFKSGQGLKTRLDYLLDFFRKYFDEPELNADPGKIRGVNDQSDVPQVPPLPELTGAGYSGLSS